MRYIIATICLLSIHYLPGQETKTVEPTESWELTKAKWEKFTDYEGQFSVKIPAPLNEKIDSIDTPLGILVYHTFYLAPTDENTENEVYMISYVDYPEGTIHQDSTELINALLDETQEAAVDAVRGELLFTKEGRYKGFPYRYWRIDYLNGRGSIRTKAFFADHRYYTIQTVNRRVYSMNHSRDRFIDSFHIFNKK